MSDLSVIDFGFGDTYSPSAVRIERSLHKTFVHVLLPTPRQVCNWALARGIEAKTGPAEQPTPASPWYRHTRAVVEIPGVKLVVSACECASTLEKLPPLPVAVAL